MSPERQKQLNGVTGIAVRLEAETGLPARLMIAQWAVESKWGAAPIGDANYFGMKRSARHKKFCVMTTHEDFTQSQMSHWNATHPTNPCRNVTAIPGTNKFGVLLYDNFADYANLEESCKDYAWLITHGDPYIAAWKRFESDRDFDELAKSVLSTYATAQYGELALLIAGQSNVTAAISEAISA